MQSDYDSAYKPIRTSIRDNRESFYDRLASSVSVPVTPSDAGHSVVSNSMCSSKYSLPTTSNNAGSSVMMVPMTAMQNLEKKEENKFENVYSMNMSELEDPSVLIEKIIDLLLHLSDCDVVVCHKLCEKRTLTILLELVSSI